MLNVRVQETQAAPNRPQKQTMVPALFNSDTLVDSTVTVCLIHVDKTMKRSGARTRACRNPTPMMNDFGLKQLRQAQRLRKINLLRGRLYSNNRWLARSISCETSDTIFAKC